MLDIVLGKIEHYRFWIAYKRFDFVTHVVQTIEVIKCWIKSIACKSKIYVPNM